MSKQKGDKEHFPYYAFLSWRNVWHGWGNMQAFALLKAARVLNDDKILRSAANEINHFYPYVLSKNFLKSFVLNKNESDSQIEQFEQIAYAVRPMAWATLELSYIKSDTLLARQAGKLAAWLSGENVLRTPLYDPSTGRCYDGISSAESLNQNSGAESTIEALLTLLEIEKNPVAFKYLKSSFRKNTHEQH